MKKKLVIALDILVIAIVAFVMFAGKSVQSIVTGMKSTSAMAANEELSFNLKASPEKARVKAGATVVVTLSAEDIKVGEEGLNNIVGKLGYDEALFESVEIYAGGPEEKETTKWELELNRIKDHKLYGKFCIFTMQEGVKENQNVATLIFKLKSDLKPQTTKVTFTELESSDGNVSIPEDSGEMTYSWSVNNVPVSAGSAGVTLEEGGKVLKLSGCLKKDYEITVVATHGGKVYTKTKTVTVK